MSAVEEIRVKVAARLQEVEEEIASLRSALEALDAEAAAAASATLQEVKASAALEEVKVSAGVGRPAKSAQSSKSSKSAKSAKPARRRAAKRPEPDARTAAQLAELERRLEETGGPEMVALARETGMDPAEVLARIVELERAGRATT